MKEWYIRINRAAEGPFSVNDLLCDARVDEKTFAWKRGMAAWMPIEQIPELATLFKKAGQKPQFKSPEEGYEEEAGGERILALSQDPFYYFVLFVIIVILVAYILYEIHS